MYFSGLLIAIALSFAAANPVPGEAVEAGLASNCGGSIGNCYDNGCDGNANTLVCLGGTYIGCPCGFDCNGRGPCNGNGCNGVAGRCTANFLGCACS